MQRTLNIRWITGICTGLFFVLFFLYFYRLNSFHLAYLEQNQLFRFDQSFFSGFMKKPSGLTDYLGQFFTQFFISPFWAAAIVTLAAFLSFLFGKLALAKFKINGEIWALLPVLVIAALHSNQQFTFGYTIAFLLSLGFATLLVSIRQEKYLPYLALAGWIPFWFVTGAFSFLTAILYLLYEFKIHPQKKVLPIFIAFTALAVITPFTLGKLLFEVQIGETWTTPLLFPREGLVRYLLFALFLFLPATIVAGGFLFPLYRKGEPGYNSPYWLKLTAGVLIVAGSSWGIYRYIYDSRTELFYRIDQSAQQGDWNKVLKLAGDYPGTNRLVLYYTNLALCQTGQMGNRLFNYYQDGNLGLWLEWERNGVSPLYGSEIFYHLNYINEAYRWSFEAMMAKGQSPRLLKRLVVTSIINGDYKIAEKYLNLLDQTLFYQDWAKKYRAYVDQPELAANDPEISAKRKLKITRDFISVGNQQDIGLLPLLENNPTNRMAFEYYMASLLLTKNMDQFVNELPRIKELNYKQLPIHYEEALFAYLVATRKDMTPAGYTISKATSDRFDQYYKAYTSAGNDPNYAKQSLYKRFGNTFWYYLNFSNPQAQ